MQVLIYKNYYDILMLDFKLNNFLITSKIVYFIGLVNLNYK